MAQVQFYHAREWFRQHQNIRQQDRPVSKWMPYLSEGEIDPWPDQSTKQISLNPGQAKSMFNTAQLLLEMKGKIDGFNV